MAEQARPAPDARRFWVPIIALGIALPLLPAINAMLGSLPPYGDKSRGYFIFVGAVFVTAQVAIGLAYVIADKLKHEVVAARALSVSLVLTLVLILELFVGMGLRVAYGHSHFPISVNNMVANLRMLFSGPYEPHLGLVARPRANFSAPWGVSHTSHSTRTVVGSPTNAGKRIALIGGSTTYGTGVSDLESWPSQLQQTLGDKVELVNFGVSGFTSVENIWQTAFYIPDEGYSCAVYYIGANDERLANADRVDPDFESFHLRDQITKMNVQTAYGYSGASLFALEYMAKAIWSGIFPPQLAASISGRISADFDPRVERFFRRNLKTIAAINRAHGIRTIFIPPLSNPMQPPWKEWVYFVEPQAVHEHLRRLGKVMADVGSAEGVEVLMDVTKLSWEDSDFGDWSHFNPKGSRKFAASIAGTIKRQCVD